MRSASVNAVADTMPADAVIGGVPIHPNHEGLADQIFLRNKAPEAAIVAVVTVVTHDKVVMGRYHVVTIERGPVVVDKYMVFHSQYILIYQMRTGFANTGAHAFINALLLLSKLFPVHKHLFVVIGNTVTRQTNNALDIVSAGIIGITEHYDITTLGFTNVDDFSINHRQADAIVKFVHQNKIAHQQGWHHGTGRNTKGLNDK